MKLCKLCHAIGKKMAKAHIIPKSLYGVTLRDPSGPARLISSLSPSIVKRSPTGEYDPDLVCEECEASFSAFDDYAKKLFVDAAPSESLFDCGEALAYRFDNIEIQKLQRFFYSLAWRMGATNRQPFSVVKLGKYAESLRTALLQKSFQEVPELDVVLSRFDTRGNGMLFPTRLRISGVNGYRVVFAGYTCWIKIDRRPFPVDFDEVALSTGEPLHMLAMDFRSSPEARVMKRLVNPWNEYQ